MNNHKTLYKSGTLRLDFLIRKCNIRDAQKLKETNILLHLINATLHYSSHIGNFTELFKVIYQVMDHIYRTMDVPKNSLSVKSEYLVKHKAENNLHLSENKLEFKSGEAYPLY